MNPPTNILLQEIVKLDSVKLLKASITSSVRYGSIVGITTIMGGIVGGPLGLALGGIISSFVMGYKARDNLHSVPYIITHVMTSDERKELEKLLRTLAMKHSLTIYDFIHSLSTNMTLQEGIVQLLIMFFSSQLGISMSKGEY